MFYKWVPIIIVVVIVLTIIGTKGNWDIEAFNPLDYIGVLYLCILSLPDSKVSQDRHIYKLHKLWLSSLHLVGAPWVSTSLLETDLPRFGLAPGPLQLGVKVTGAASCLLHQIPRGCTDLCSMQRGKWKWRKGYLTQTCHIFILGFTFILSHEGRLAFGVSTAMM